MSKWERKRGEPEPEPENQFCYPPAYYRVTQRSSFSRVLRRATISRQDTQSRRGARRSPRPRTPCRTLRTLRPCDPVGKAVATVTSAHQNSLDRRRMPAKACHHRLHVGPPGPTQSTRSNRSLAMDPMPSPPSLGGLGGTSSAANQYSSDS